MNQGYLFRNVWLVGDDATYAADMRVRGRRIQEIGSELVPAVNEIVLECSDYLACPGLINSHDHLQFNLFPRLGEPPYNNAHEWGQDLHTRWRSTLESIQRVPMRLRLLWGAWKNLLSGTTHVIHHDPYSHYFRFHFPVDVFKRYTFAHSIYYEPDLRRTLGRRKRGTPFLIHLAEGKDDFAASEVASVMNIGGLDERTVAVHAINISQSDIDLLQQTKTSVVWCPSSNMFLFEKTAPVPSLLGRICVALGTDSTLTGSITLFEEMRCARRATDISAKDLFRLVTVIPRRIFGLPPDAGALIEGGNADLFLLPFGGADPYERILNANPADICLMMKRGKIVFFDDRDFAKLLNGGDDASLRFAGRRKIVRDQRCVELCKTLRPFLDHYSYLSPN